MPEVRQLVSAVGGIKRSYVDAISRLISGAGESADILAYASAGVAQAGPFNVFRLVSDLYYRENFHSDIIAHFLDPTASHGHGDAFLKAFIALLGGMAKSADYADAEVRREKGRIDILIASLSSRHAIVVENKMNNASDQYRQLPRYYDYCVGNSLVVDAIVYVPLFGKHQPNRDGWFEDDTDHVVRRLMVLSAVAGRAEQSLVES